MLRLAVAVLAGGLVLAALAAFAFHAYGAHRRERARMSFEARWGDLARYSPPPPVPDHENGARWLTAGGRAILCSLEDQKFYSRLSAEPVRDWTDTERSRAQWILHEQQNALKILLRAGEFDSFHLGAPGLRPTHEEIDSLSIIKGLRLLMLESRLAWSEGRSADSLAALAVVGRAVDGLLQTPVVMASILGSAAGRWFAGSAAELVRDPCTAEAELDTLCAALPSQDAVHSGNVTLAVAISEIGDEGLAYIDDLHDPSLGWSVPFWVSNRYLLEDLIIAEIVERWGRHLDLGQVPAARWPAGAVDVIWGDNHRPPWIALAGTFFPNLVSVLAREQAADTELQQLRAAIELRLASPSGLDSEACRFFADQTPTALTGEPVTCRPDLERGVIVIEVPGAQETLVDQVATDNDAGRIAAIELPVGPRRTLCTAPEAS
jgi:hypothetical protein